MKYRATVAGAATPPIPGRAGLTLRQIEILQLIAEGLNNQAIAERLFTVHRHVANLMTKLNVSSRSAAVAHVSRLGLI